MYEVTIFHGLSSFYRKFIKQISSLRTPIIETIEEINQAFTWTIEVKKKTLNC